MRLTWATSVNLWPCLDDFEVKKRVLTASAGEGLDFCCRLCQIINASCQIIRAVSQGFRRGRDGFWVPPWRPGSEVSKREKKVPRWAGTRFPVDLYPLPAPR